MYQLTALKHTYQLRGVTISLRMRTTISPGQWQPWTAVSPLLQSRTQSLLAFGLRGNASKYSGIMELDLFFIGRQQHKEGPTGGW